MLDQVAISEISTDYQIERILNPRDNSYIRASGIGSCKRQIAYRIRGYKEGVEELPIWTHGLHIFSLGHSIHFDLQHRLSNVGNLKWIDAEPYIDNTGKLEWKGNIEVPLSNSEYRIAGRCDGLTKPLKRVKVEVDGQFIDTIEPTDEQDPDGKRYIIDIKSITARERLKIEADPDSGYVRACESLPSPFEKLAAPKDEHISQASLYSWMTTQPGFHTDRLFEPLKDMPGIMIIYVAKDLDPEFYGRHPGLYPGPKSLLNSPHKVFTQDVNQRAVNTLLRKVSSIWEHLDKGSLPPRDYNHTPNRVDYHCVDCPFRSACYEVEGFFKDEDLTFPPLLQHRASKVREDLIVLR